MGSTWIIETAASPQEVSDCCDLALDSSNQPHICYNELMSGTKLFYTTKTGGAWHSEKLGWGGAFCRIAIDSAGNPLCGGFGEALFLFSKTGEAWTYQVVDSEGYNFALTVDRRDRPCFAYQLMSGKAIRYAVYDDYKWLNSEISGADGYGFSLQFGMDGNPQIAVLDATDYTHSSISYFWNEGDCGW